MVFVILLGTIAANMVAYRQLRKLSQDDAQFNRRWISLGGLALGAAILLITVADSQRWLDPDPDLTLHVMVGAVIALVLSYLGLAWFSFQSDRSNKPGSSS